MMRTMMRTMISSCGLTGTDAFAEKSPSLHRKFATNASFCGTYISTSKLKWLSRSVQGWQFTFWVTGLAIS